MSGGVRDIPRGSGAPYCLDTFDASFVKDPGTKIGRPRKDWICPVSGADQPLR